MKTSVLVDKIDRLVKEQMTKRDPKAEKKHQLDEISRRDKDIRKLQADLRDERDKANKNVTRLNEEISVQWFSIRLMFFCSSLTPQVKSKQILLTRFLILAHRCTKSEANGGLARSAEADA